MKWMGDTDDFTFLPRAEILFLLLRKIKSKAMGDNI